MKREKAVDLGDGVIRVGGGEGEIGKAFERDRTETPCGPPAGCRQRRDRSCRGAWRWATTNTPKYCGQLQGSAAWRLSAGIAVGIEQVGEAG